MESWEILGSRAKIHNEIKALAKTRNDCPTYKFGKVGTAVFKDIPNNDEGNAFIAKLKKYKNKRYRLRVRARGPRTKHARANGLWPRSYDQDLPMKYAETFTVYIDDYDRRNSPSYSLGFYLGVIWSIEYFFNKLSKVLKLS